MTPLIVSVSVARAASLITGTVCRTIHIADAQGTGVLTLGTCGHACTRTVWVCCVCWRNREGLASRYRCPVCDIREGQ